MELRAEDVLVCVRCGALSHIAFSGAIAPDVPGDGPVGNCLRTLYLEGDDGASPLSECFGSVWRLSDLPERGS